MSRLADTDVWQLETYIVPSDDLSGGTLVVGGPEAHHAVDVRRTRPGQTVRLIDGSGVEALARVEEVRRAELALGVTERRTLSRREGVSLTVIQALPKGRGMDEVVRRCAELGVATIVPVLSERTVSRPDGRAARERLDRWRSVAAAATKQSRGVFLTEVVPLTDLDDVADRVRGADLSMVAWENERSRSIESALGAGELPAAITVVVGPEGGLTAGEVESLRMQTAEPVGLGHRILRADWAAAAFAAMISERLGGLLP